MNISAMYKMPQNGQFFPQIRKPFSDKNKRSLTKNPALCRAFNLKKHFLFVILIQAFIGIATQTI